MGGAVGGVVALAALILLFWFLRRRRKRDDFDGNFDPDRVVAAGGHNDLLDSQVTPYSYNPADGGSDMRQHGGNAALLGAAGLGAGVAAGAASHGRQSSTSTGISGYAGQGKGGRPLSDPASAHDWQAYGQQEYAPSEAPTSHSGGGQSSSGGYPYGASPYPLAAGAGAAYLGGGVPAPGESLPSTASSPNSSVALGGASAARTAKEREAFRNQSPNRSPGPQQQYMSFPQPTPYQPQDGASGSGAGGAGRYSGYGYGASGAPLTLRNVPGEDEEVRSEGGMSDGQRSSEYSGPPRSEVLVHQDGGRVPQPAPHEDEREDPTEIPPTYDSIRVDQDHV